MVCTHSWHEGLSDTIVLMVKSGNRFPVEPCLMFTAVTTEENLAWLRGFPVRVSLKINIFCMKFFRLN